VRDQLATRVRAADLLQRSAERAGQLAQGPRHLDPARARLNGRYLQAAGGERLPDEVDVGGVGSVPLGQLVAGQEGRPGDHIGGKRGPAPQHQGQLRPLGGVKRPGRRGVRQRRTFAAS